MTTCLHRNVFTRIRFWLQKYLTFDSVDPALKQRLFSRSLYLKPTDVLRQKVVELTQDLLNLASFYQENEKRIVVFLLFFLNRNIETELTSIATKRLREMVENGDLSINTLKLLNDPRCELVEALPFLYV